jgi:iron complex outermembrane receptor protein
MILAATALTPAAAAATSVSPDNLFEMSLEQLMDIPVVISASRQPQKITFSSVPISIITADDIHYSGMTNLADILQFAPGVDVLPLSRIRSAVGVRGLHDFIADRTLTLINGRAADSLIFGGSEFYRLPILVEDIERIEIVRGPGGAAWGANAFTGVINIITKKPGQTPGWLLSTTVTEFGDTYNHIRWMGKKDKWSWRISTGYEDTKDSDAAGAGRISTSRPALNPLIGFDSFTAQDYARNSRIDTEFSYDYSDQTKFSFGTAYSHLERGDWEFLGYFPGGNAWYETIRNFARIDHLFDDDTSGHLQWTGNFSNAKQPSLFKWFIAENEIEAQYNLKAGPHELTFGGNFKWIHINADMLDAQSIKILGEPLNETLCGLFFIDRWRITDAFSLEAQVRSDWYSGTQSDWSTRLSALMAIDDAQNNVLRMSFAKAYRSPYASPRDNETHRVFHPGLMTYLINVVKENELRNEETWALEAGYTSRLTDLLTFRVDAYYQRFEHLIAYRSNTSIPQFFVADNIDGADSWGVETELALENKDGRLSLWYAWNDFEADTPRQPLRTYMPAQHKVGINGRLYLQDGMTLNANYRYKSTTPVSGDTTIFPVDPDHRLDLTVSKTFARGNAEWMLGVADVFNKTQGPNWTIGNLSSFETPGRTFFARLQLRF